METRSNQKTMIYDEIAKELSRLGAESGKPVRSVEDPEMRTTAVYILPAAWLIAFEPATTLFLGRYEGDDLRLVGTRQIPFSELTLKGIQHEFNSALQELRCN